MEEEMKQVLIFLSAALVLFAVETANAQETLDYATDEEEHNSSVAKEVCL